MSKSWFYRSAGKVSGPFEFEGLTELVGTGALQPSDELRRGETGHWMQAGSVVGLFPEPEELQNLDDLNFHFVETACTDAAKSQSAPQLATLDDLNIQIVTEAKAPQRRATAGGGERSTADVPDEPPVDGWFYKSLGQELGPMPFDELARLARDGVLARDDAVRHGNSGAWQRAIRVSELVDEFPPVEVPPPAPVDPKDATKSAGKKNKRRRAKPVPRSDAPDDGIPQDTTADTDDVDPDLPPPPPAPPQERWFCMIDEVEHGPLTRDELEAMAKHARIKPDTRTKLGDDGQWKVAAVIDGLFPAVPASAPAGFGAAAPIGSTPSAYAAPKVKKEKKAKVKRARGPSEPLMPRIGEFFAKNKPIVFGALGVAVIAAVVLFFAMGQSGAYPEYVTRLREILDEHNALKQRKAPKSEWEPLRNKAKALSDEILPILTKTASSKYPERQELLWATQDMSGMLAKGPDTPNPDETNFVNHLKRAAEILKLDSNISAVSSDGKAGSKKSR